MAVLYAVVWPPSLPHEWTWPGLPDSSYSCGVVLLLGQARKYEASSSASPHPTSTPPLPPQAIPGVPLLFSFSPCKNSQAFSTAKTPALEPKLEHSQHTALRPVEMPRRIEFGKWNKRECQKKKLKDLFCFVFCVFIFTEFSNENVSF